MAWLVKIITKITERKGSFPFFGIEMQAAQKC